MIVSMAWARSVRKPHHPAVASWIGWVTNEPMMARTAVTDAMRTIPIGCTASSASDSSWCMPSVSLNTHSTTRSGARHARSSSSPPPKECPRRLTRSMSR